MTKETRLKLGKLWYEQFKASPNSKRADGITAEHPYIKEYLDSLPKEEETKKKGGK